MSGKVIIANNITGLFSSEIPALRQQYGKNIFRSKPTRRFIHIAGGIVKEPMFILLLVACSLYFILGQTYEGFLMLVAMIFVTAISFYQEIRSTNALKILEQFTEPMVTVLRDGKEMTVLAEELVPGDIILLEEGMKIPADAVILQENDLYVNESIITGESLPVDKIETQTLYQGTTVNSGKCISQVIATGNNTVLGKLGKSVVDFHSSKTLLQLQLNRFLRLFTSFGLVAFVFIFFMNFLEHREWTTSLLFALTLAMSAIPEEIPVAFSSFMALGAYRMSKLGIITRQAQVIENLGAVSVFCFDKTGTLTENKMQLKTIYNYKNDVTVDLSGAQKTGSENLLNYAVLASEWDPFDPMEKAIWDAYRIHSDAKMHLSQKMIFEYPLEGKPPMMTHVYEQGTIKIVAAKGAPERIIDICKLSDPDYEKANDFIRSESAKGYRILGVASAVHTAPQLPARQDDFNWRFEGLLALYDPPKKNAAIALKQCYEAKVNVKLLTGDYPVTAITIAGQVGIMDHLKCINGEEVMSMPEHELKRVVKETSVFARMFPDAKLKVIDALKTNGEIVAMTGDGVNDAPALKSANIGIAMGRKGTEIARQAADLILTDDNLEKLVTAISEGRKIFNNFKKAIRYIISIHIPIILVSSLPLLFGWTYPNIFTPVHIIFLELIMGPTCSVFFEREPVEKNLMSQPPRKRNVGVFTKMELSISMLQGIVISLGILFLYYFYMRNGASVEQTRTIVFTTLILSNVFLTFANRSFSETIFQTSRYKNNLSPIILFISVLFMAAFHLVPAIRNLFQLSTITTGQICICFGVAFVSVMWIELCKPGMVKRKLR